MTVTTICPLCWRSTRGYARDLLIDVSVGNRRAYIHVACFTKRVDKAFAKVPPAPEDVPGYWERRGALHDAERPR